MLLPPAPNLMLGVPPVARVVSGWQDSRLYRTGTAKLAIDYIM